MRYINVSPSKRHGTDDGCSIDFRYADIVVYVPQRDPALPPRGEDGDVYDPAEAYWSVSFDAGRGNGVDARDRLLEVLYTADDELNIGFADGSSDRTLLPIDVKLAMRLTAKDNVLHVQRGALSVDIPAEGLSCFAGCVVNTHTYADVLYMGTPSG